MGVILLQTSQPAYQQGKGRLGPVGDEKLRLGQGKARGWDRRHAHLLKLSTIGILVSQTVCVWLRPGAEVRDMSGP